MQTNLEKMKNTKHHQNAVSKNTKKRKEDYSQARKTKRGE